MSSRRSCGSAVASPRLVSLRTWGAAPSLERATKKSSSSAFDSSARGVTASTRASCASLVQPSIISATLTDSLMPSGSLMSATAGGLQGKLTPPASALTAPRALLLMISPLFASSTTSCGMPETSNSLESCPLRLSDGGTEHHEGGIEPKYSLKLPASLSDDTKMTATFLPAASTFSYVLLSFGVNALQGGHLRCNTMCRLWTYAKCGSGGRACMRARAPVA
mmetsp:Transcript_53711/g.123551  ORF Transcript_53711/g.123551 Transcript_53711/m.123551 type:complete len:222 (+) Transcript_53711:440-1105(+)